MSDSVNPLVSVIVPVYNVEKYIRQCLESLVNQTLKEIEIIIVNDGSTDNSLNIAQEYSERSDIIKVYTKVNGGLSDARNYGLDRANGEYVGFVDSDDWVEHDMFNALVNKAIVTNSDIVVCSMMNHNETGEALKEFHLGKNAYLFGSSIRQEPELLHACGSYACNKIFKRSLFNNHRFPKSQWFEDSAIVYNIMLDANKLEIVDRFFYHYRAQREGAITNSVSPKIFDAFLSCDQIMSHFKKQGFHTKKQQEIIERLVHKHLFARVKLILKSPPNKVGIEYINRCFSYLDCNFPGWKKRIPLPKSIKGKIERKLRLNRIFCIIYISMPRQLLKISKKLTWKFIHSRRKSEVKKVNWMKSKPIMENGFEVLKMIDQLFREHSVNYFADFGTLLGFVREKGFLSHDLDIDLGIFDDHSKSKNIRAILATKGFELWREYIMEGKVVEESYRYFFTKDVFIKIDFNFYFHSSDKSKTWLFYSEPSEKYSPRERSIVEMTYSKIPGIKNLNINNIQIPVPLNYEILLEEKYGPTWQVPDKNWIYWESPAAIKLKNRGHFVHYSSNSNKNFSTKKIPDDKLRDLQLAQLEILDVFEQICKQHALTYYLSDGTLLGAVRHEGHIPWDDDIDVSMPREDYIKFINLSASELPSSVAIWSYKSDPSYHLPFAKLVGQRNSQFKNTFPPNIKPEFSGPRIDVFPLDSVPSEFNFNQYIRANVIRACRRLLIIKAGLNKYNGFRKIFLNFCAKNIPYSFLHKTIDSQAQAYNQSFLNKYYVNYFTPYELHRVTAPIDFYNPPVMLRFEGKQRSCPKNYTYLLEKEYGDYTTLPPKKDRINNSHYMKYFPKPEAKI